ncbi:energy-coupling factor transporter transmembrane protein EcfT [Helcococcus kunzii]|uniref:energy-coupling factor transporter transmembrane component T family protein n=1 Tax=Helcococcus kunzii TaxID=40091 RepID=UPI001BB0AB90|nr:energy-coupling factor transporter transmembrane component T [Helcococcus kunzii]QUY65648.1 energy-coupling factor transporter transmembrane protein EcfT [Helcococcus kunzii]
MVKKLNPAYKMITMIIASLLLSIKYVKNMNFLIFFICIFLTLINSKSKIKKILFAMIPLLIATTAIFATGVLFPGDEVSGDILFFFFNKPIHSSSIENGLRLSSRILAYGGIGFLFAYTTNSLELIMSLMQQFSLSPKFAYSILAAYNFFPIIKSEYNIVRGSAKIRGIHANPLSTKYLLPMVVHSIERSESLAMAMVSRGFDEHAERGIAFNTSFSYLDVVFLVGVNLAIIVGLILG